MKLAILVIASPDKLYDQLVVEYWYPFMRHIKNNYNNEVCIYLVYGNSDNILPILEGSDQVLRYHNIEENYVPGIYLKTIEAIKQLDNTFNYDFLFRTNLSSFILISELIAVVDCLSKQSKKIYAGIIGHTTDNNKLSFISGSGCIMSKNVVNKLIIKHNNLNNFGSRMLYKFNDDVVIGLLLSGIPRITTKRLNIHNNMNYLNQNELDIIYNKIINDKHYHIRIKNEENRDVDIQIISYLAKIWYK